MRKFIFQIDPESKTKLTGLSLGYICFTGVKTEKRNEIIDQEISAASHAVKERFKDTKAIADDLMIKGIRSVFSKAGMDPTKERASGEALIRRIVGGQGIYRVNTVVDTNNVISIRTGCPCGVYDLDKVEGGTISLIVGRSGETYEGIGGKPLNAENRILTKDGKGFFGGPTADSARTSIMPATKEVLMLIYHPASSSSEILGETMKLAIMKMGQTTGAKAEDSGIINC